MNLRIPVGVIVLAVLFFAFIGITIVKIQYDKADPSSIDSFAACVDAGNPVMESYPRQCATRDGRTFTEAIESNESAVQE